MEVAKGFDKKTYSSLNDQTNRGVTRDRSNGRDLRSRNWRSSVDHPDAAAVASFPRRSVNWCRVRVGVYAGDAHDRCVIIMCIHVHSQQILLHLICLFFTQRWEDRA